MTLEELLKKLIEKGWKPFGESRIDEINRAEQYAGNWNWCCWGSKDAIQRRKSTRQLVSKESGLWQFVCENGMVRITEQNSLCNWLFGEKIYYDETHTEKLYKNNNYEYRLIESSLKDESELEDFLLDNIQLGQ